MAKFCLFFMMALLFIIVPMPILSVDTKITSYVSKPLKKVVEFFNGKDYYDYKHVIEKVQKTVEIFEPKDDVALAKLKNIVRGALEKLPEIIKQNIRTHDFYVELLDRYKKSEKGEAYSPTIKAYMPIYSEVQITMYFSSIKTFLDALDETVKTKKTRHGIQIVTARDQFERILYATKNCDQDKEYNPGKHHYQDKKMATLCHKLQPLIYPFLEAFEDELVLLKKCKEFLESKNSLEKLKNILEKAVEKWNPSAKELVIHSPEDFLHIYAKNAYQNKRGDHKAVSEDMRKELFLALKEESVGKIRSFGKPVSACEYLDTMIKAKQICAGKEVPLSTVANNNNYDIAELGRLCNVELVPKIDGFIEKLFIEDRDT